MHTDSGDKSSEFKGFTIGEYGVPGPLRDALVAGLLNGKKTATTSLLAWWDSDPVASVGMAEIVVDSAGKPVCVLRITGVEIFPLAEVGDDIAQAEGEGFTSAAEWRTAHEKFFREADAQVVIDDRTPVVVQYLQLVQAL